MPRKPAVKQVWAADVPRWQVDQRAVEAAIRLLKLRFPVTVRPARMVHQRGMYTGLDHGYHGVVLAYNMRSDNASKSLWHELAHAYRREMCKTAAEFNDRYDKQLLSLGLRPLHYYADKPIPKKYRLAADEQEALSLEHMHNILPLCEAGQPSQVWIRRREGRGIIVL